MIILRQKQYGLIGKSAHRFIGRIINTQKGIDNKMKMSRKANNGGASDSNKDLNMKLLKKAQTLGITAGSVLGNEPGSITKNNFTREFLKDAEGNTGKILRKSISRGHTGYINVNSHDHTPGEIAHEMGHVIYSRTPKGIKNTKNSFKFLEKRSERREMEPKTRGEAIRMSLGNLGNLSTLKTEIAASRIGMKELKKLGATKEQLKEARRELRPAFMGHLTTHLIHSSLPISKFKDK